MITLMAYSEYNTIDVRDSGNQPGSGSAFIQCGSWSRALGFTEDVWHQKHENKKECFQKDLKFYNIWKNLSSFEVQSPWSGFWLKPDPHHWKLETKCYEILDHFESILFCFHAFGVRRPLWTLEPCIRIRIEWMRIRIQAGFLNLGHLWNVWHQKYEHNKKAFKNI